MSTYIYFFTFDLSFQVPLIISKVYLFEHFPFLSPVWRCYHSPCQILLLSFSNLSYPSPAIHVLSCYFLRVSELLLSLLVSFISVSWTILFFFPMLESIFQSIAFLILETVLNITCHFNRTMAMKKNPNVSELKSTYNPQILTNFSGWLNSAMEWLNEKNENNLFITEHKLDLKFSNKYISELDP